MNSWRLCLAFSTDDNLDYWEKSEHNPVLARPREGDENFGVYSVFDPDCWIENGMYYSVQGDKPLGGGKKPYDTLFLFKSKDLINWQYSHTLYEANPEWTIPDDDSACPSFYPRGAQYYVGKYENERFYPEKHNFLCTKRNTIVCAPETMLDDKERRIALFTLGSGSYPEEIMGGMGFVTSLPVIFSANDTGSMYIDPAEEIKKLRFEKLEHNNIKINAGNEVNVAGVKGRIIELQVKIACDAEEYFQIRLACSPDKKSHVAIGINRKKNIIYSISTYKKDRTDYALKLALDDRENIKLNIFIDRSVIEVFANRKQYFVERAYAPVDCDGISFCCVAHDSEIKNIKKWNMARA